MPEAARMLLMAAPLVLAAAANGQQPPPPLSAEYAAEYRIESQGVVSAGRVYAAPGKERREMNGPSGPLVVILRHDLRLVWTLMPPSRAYAETPAPPPPAPPAPATAIGEAVIEGIPTTKYRLAPAAAAGGPDASAQGHVWLTADGIPIRIEQTGSQGGRRIGVMVSLMNLRIGPQDPALFEVPAGYRKVVLAPPPPAVTH